MVEIQSPAHITKGSLNFFSKELTFELKNILKSLFGTEVGDAEAQEIGRHIAQFVFLKETSDYTGAKEEYAL